MGLEFEGAAVFGYGSDDVVGGAFRDLGVDFERDFEPGAHEPGEVLDDLFSNPSCVPA